MARLPDRSSERKYVYEKVDDRIENKWGKKPDHNAVYSLQCERQYQKEKFITENKRFFDDLYSEPHEKQKRREKARQNHIDIREKGDQPSFDIQHADGPIYPQWIDSAYEADEIYYVGMSNDVSRRITDHVLGTKSGAMFTKLFPPVKIHDVEYFETRKEAKKKEQEVAEDLKEKKPKQDPKVIADEANDLYDYLNKIHDNDESEMTKFVYQL